MTKNILQEVMDILSGIKDLRYVAEDWGQLDYEQPPVQWPCALIDIQGVQYCQLGEKGLMGRCRFTIQVTNRPAQRTSTGAAKKQQVQNLVLFGIMDQITAALHGRGSEHHAPFVLKESDKAAMVDLQSYVMTFETEFKTNNRDTRTAIPAAPVLKPRMEQLSQMTIAYGQKKTATS